MFHLVTGRKHSNLRDMQTLQSPVVLYTKQLIQLFVARLGNLIHSEKHENTWSFLGQNASSVQDIVVVEPVDRAGINTAVPQEVAIGSTIRSIYFEFHFSAAQTGNVNVIHWQIMKEVATQTLSAPNTYNQVDKSQIFKRGMEMLPVNVATVYKRIFVIKIPKGKQRMMQGSRWLFRYIASSTQTINTCGITVFKEYT